MGNQVISNLKNQIILDDCLSILKKIPDQTFDCIITDPPYLYLPHKLDAPFDEELLFSELYRTLKNDSFLAYFGRGEHYFKWGNICSQLGMKFKEELIWDKMKFSTPTLKIGRQHENISIFVKGKKSLNKVKIDKIERDSLTDSHRLIQDIQRIISSIKKINSLEELEDFKNLRWKPTIAHRKHKLTCRKALINYDRGCTAFNSLSEGCLIPSIMRFKPEHFNYQHPTQKPITLISRLIEILSNPEDLILDPFAGSGTLAIAALNLNRSYFCVEKDEEYFNIINNRIIQWHNQKVNESGTHEIPNFIPRIKEEATGQLNLF